MKKYFLGIIIILSIVQAMQYRAEWNNGSIVLMQSSGNDSVFVQWNNGSIFIQQDTGTTAAGGVALKWQGSISTDAVIAGNYYPVNTPDSLDTITIDSGAVNWVLGSPLHIAKLTISGSWTGKAVYNDTLFAYYLGIAVDSSQFNAPAVIRDSVVYSGTSNPIGYAGSKILSISGSILTIKLNGKFNTPRIVNVPGGKIRWR